MTPEQIDWLRVLIARERREELRLLEEASEQLSAGNHAEARKCWLDSEERRLIAEAYESSLRIARVSVLH